MRIGGGAGYSGDRIEPAVELATRGDLDIPVQVGPGLDRGHDDRRSPDGSNLTRDIGGQVADAVGVVMPRAAGVNSVASRWACLVGSGKPRRADT